MIGNQWLGNSDLNIVDIGASGGIDPRWQKFTSKYKAVLFEPDPREFENLKSNSSDNFVILNAALSEKSGERDFHLCKKQQVSSVYMPNFDFINKYPDPERFSVEKTIKIMTDTLDKQLQTNNIHDIDFIKIDTQGHELAILHGAQKSLGTVIGLELEVEFVSLYKNQPLFNEVDTFVRNQGFELIDLRRYFWKRNGVEHYGERKGQLVFGDALYFRSPENILAMDGLTEEKIIKAICIYFVYGYVDLGLTLLETAYRNRKISQDTFDMVSSVFFDLKNVDFTSRFYAGTDTVLGNVQ